MDVDSSGRAGRLHSPGNTLFGVAMRPTFLAAWGVAGILGGAAFVAATPTAAQGLGQVPIDDIPVPPLRAVEVAAGPATMPSGGGPAAADPVAAPAPVVIAPGSKVILLPFDGLGDSGAHAWVGRAIQDSLGSEVARLKDLSPVSTDPQGNTAAGAPAGPTDTAGAIAQAKAAGADVVVFGSYQFLDTDVRMTGQVVDVATGQAIAGLKASGEFRDLFSLEDQLGSQLRTALRPPPPVTEQDRLADNQTIFGQQTPPLTNDDLYSIPGYSPQFQDAYNRYYYDWNDFSDYGGYGGGFGGFGYGGFGFGGGFGGRGGFGHGGHGFGGGGHHGGGHRVGYKPPTTPPFAPAPGDGAVADAPVFTPVEQGPPRFVNMTQGVTLEHFPN
jgi:TolB-like protein